MKKLCWIVILILSLQPINSQNKRMKKTGDILVILIPASTLIGTLISGDNQGALEFSKGFLVNQAVTFGLKKMINKPRPDGSNLNSFPSGHTSTAFQSAAFLQKRYGSKLGTPAFILAALTGYTRISAKKHDYLDVLAGSIIGISSAVLFTKPYHKKQMKLTFSNKDNGYQIGFIYQF